MAEDYDRQKLSEAAGVLATSPESIQARLEYALSPLLVLQSAQGMANQSRQPELDSIVERLTADKSDSAIGYGPTTIRGLSDDAARAIARDIFELYSGCCQDTIFRLEDQLRTAA
jgi:hypothetical protein